MKTVIFLASSLNDIKAFCPTSKKESGHQIDQVQKGLDPDDWKPMPEIGLGVREIRIHTESEYRIIYIAKFPEAVYILHAFVKKTQKTEKKDIDLAVKRLKELIQARKNND